MTYKVVNGKIHLNNDAISATNIVDKLNLYTDIFIDFKKMFQKHDVKTIAGNLRYLVDYFDNDDEKTDVKDKEVQNCLNKAANILNAANQKLEGVEV